VREQTEFEKINTGNEEDCSEGKVWSLPFKGTLRLLFSNIQCGYMVKEVQFETKKHFSTD
jgi:hypothetical protein